MLNLNNNQKLGYLIGFLFLILSMLTFGKNISFIFLFSGIFFIYLGKKKNEYLLYITKIWLKLGLFLSKLISPIIIFILFFFLFVPIGLLVKIFSLRYFKKKPNTYWDNTEIEICSLKKQF